MEVDAVYQGHPFDYVDTQNDPIAQALFAGALAEARSRGDVDETLATGSLQLDSCIEALLAATGEAYRTACWTPDEVRRKLNDSQWPDVESLDRDDRRDVLTAQFFLQACAAGGYGIQFGG